MSDTALIDAFNTPHDGSDAAPATGTGTPGSNAIATSATFADDSFVDLSNALFLTPRVRGGDGSSATIGLVGTTPTPDVSTIGNSPTTVETTFLGGGAGADGVVGGAGGTATLALQSDTIGTTAGPYTGTISFSAIVGGGYGGGGAYGTGGGSGGFSEVLASPAEVFLGAAGGEGGSGGTGGVGSLGALSIDALSVVAAGQDIGFSLESDGGGGGPGGYGAQGGSGGEPSGGGSGGTGGAGGQATDTLSDSSFIDSGAVDIAVAAVGGSGGQGGVGVDGGAGTNDGQQGFGIPYTAVTTIGAAGNGGNGGAGAAAFAGFVGNTLTTGSVTLAIDAFGGGGGNGGAGGPAVASSESTLTDDNIVNILETVGASAGTHGGVGASGAGTITFTGNSISVTNDLSLALTADLPLNAAAGGNLVFSGNTLSGGGAGTLDISQAAQGGTVDDMNGLLSLAGSPDNSIGGFQTYVLAASQSFIDGDHGARVVQVAPDADTVVLTPGHSALTIEDATPTNLVLSFQGYGAALSGIGQVQADSRVAGGTLTISVAGDGAVTLPLTEWTAGTSDVTFAPACFAEGTRIATPGGEVPVEALAVGDMVLTAAGAARPVVWLGRRAVACTRHPAPEKVWPVRVAAGAFGPGRPARDFFLSPDHAVFVAGALVPVRLLVNGGSIAQVRVDSVTYWHVELDRHDVLLAEGLPCESFLDTGQRAAFAGGAVTALYADFSARAWDADACAPLVLGGAALARARLAA